MFKIFFDIEKKEKGFILKKIIKKYEDESLILNGKQKFIDSMDRYFDSDLSEVTDLKTILNRLNGENLEFHLQYE